MANHAATRLLSKLGKSGAVTLVQSAGSRIGTPPRSPSTHEMCGALCRDAHKSPNRRPPSQQGPENRRCGYEAFEQIGEIWGRDPCSVCWFSNRDAASITLDTRNVWCIV